jgi:ribulose-phosphate 3-epimerase
MIIPGILEETFEKTVQRIKSIEEVSLEIQIDIADGDLVEGKTFQDIEELNTLNTKSSLSIHFMVKNPAEYISKSMTLTPINTAEMHNVNTVITQVVENKKMEEFINLAKKTGYKVGISLNHDQDFISIDPFLDKIDLVQFMSVVPGKQGNDFIPEVLDKIKRFKEAYPALKTQIDGGINLNNLTQVLETGVDNVIIGSAIFNSENPRDKTLELMKAAHGSTTNS